MTEPLNDPRLEAVAQIVRPWDYPFGEPERWIKPARSQCTDRPFDSGEFTTALRVTGADELAAKFSAMVEHYVQLAGCGDCGNWEPEAEEIVISSRAALARYRALKGEG